LTLTGAEEVNRLLDAMAAGDPEALDRLVPLVYGELQRIARRQLARERPDHTLETGPLVHEAYLKLVGLDRMQWRGRAHFLAAAAGAMRRILIDHAVRRRAAKRGGGAMPVTLSGEIPSAQTSADDVLALDMALERLRELDARQALVVEHRFFAGMSIEESAEVLGVSPMTVKRDWIAARVWLNRELSA
jgi:RNA polymerase sigma factor (TIGR02999 family)